MRQTFKQRLGLGDLRHFRRRRKAFEHGRKNAMRVGGAAGRLAELGNASAVRSSKLRVPRLVAS